MKNVIKFLISLSSLLLITYLFKQTTNIAFLLATATSFMLLGFINGNFIGYVVVFLSSTLLEVSNLQIQYILPFILTNVAILLIAQDRHEFSLDEIYGGYFFASKVKWLLASIFLSISTYYQPLLLLPFYILVRSTAKEIGRKDLIKVAIPIPLIVASITLSLTIFIEGIKLLKQLLTALEVYPYNLLYLFAGRSSNLILNFLPVIVLSSFKPKKLTLLTAVIVLTLPLIYPFNFSNGTVAVHAFPFIPFFLIHLPNNYTKQVISLILGFISLTVLGIFAPNSQIGYVKYHLLPESTYLFKYAATLVESDLYFTTTLGKTLDTEGGRAKYIFIQTHQGKSELLIWSKTKVESLTIFGDSKTPSSIKLKNSKLEYQTFRPDGGIANVVKPNPFIKIKHPIKGKGVFNFYYTHFEFKTDEDIKVRIAVNG